MNDKEKDLAHILVEGTKVVYGKEKADQVKKQPKIVLTPEGERFEYDEEEQLQDKPAIVN